MTAELAPIRYDDSLDGVWFDEQIFISTDAIFRAAACIVDYEETIEEVEIIRYKSYNEH